jgi:hypothetical protein
MLFVECILNSIGIERNANLGKVAILLEICIVASLIAIMADVFINAKLGQELLFDLCPSMTGI